MIDPLPGDIFREGQVLNNTYEIEGVLGRGGTGEVYRARNQITGRWWRSRRSVGPFPPMPMISN